MGNIKEISVNPYRIVINWDNPKIGQVFIELTDHRTALFWWEVMKASAEILKDVSYPIYKMAFNVRISTSECPSSMTLESNLSYPEVLVEVEEIK